MRIENVLLIRFGALLILFLCINQLLCSQTKDTVINRLVEQLEKATENQISESVYIQTSKDIYELDEILWFKGYVLNNQSLSPSTQSKTLYVQLINADINQAVWEEKYEIENGFVEGHIYVRDTLQEGRYTLAAYTPFSFYDDLQPITAMRQLNIVKNIESYLQTNRKDTLDKARNEENTVDFQMFPEGGYLVSGITSNVAFKAVDSQGNPKAVSGTLYENNAPKASFKTEHAGMGLFNFTPDISKQYYISLDSLTIKKHYSLPTIKNRGYVLEQVSNINDTLTIKVSKNTDQEKETLYLRVQMRGVVYSAAKAPVMKELLIKIPLKDLPQGIAEITLFNQDLEPLSERLVYVNQDKKLHIKTELIKKFYVTRDNASLKITTTDEKGTPISAHLGISIFDKAYNSKENATDIISHYHLFTQLKGKIHNPRYYFDRAIKNREVGLNLLLLTQGWRRYIWNKQYLETESRTRTPLISNGLEGKLSYIKKRKTTSQQNILMVYDPLEEDKKSLVELNSLNQFTLSPAQLRIGKRLYIKHFGAQNEKIQITVKDPFKAINKTRALKKYNYPLPFIDINEEDEMPIRISRSIQEGILLEDLVVSAKRKFTFRDKYFEKLDSLAKVEMTTDYVCEFSNILNCPTHPKSKNSKKPVEGEVYLQLMVWQNDRWVTGVPKNKGDVFKNPPLPPYRYPKLTEEDLMKRFNIMRTKGYFGKREFYNPVYDELLINDPLPAYRNTLYWKADIITNNQGEAQIEFSTSDINSMFKVVIEGVSGDGQLGRQTFDFYVRSR